MESEKSHWVGQFPTGSAYLGSFLKQVCSTKVTAQSLGEHKNRRVKLKYSLGTGETKFSLGREGKKSIGSGSTGSVTEGCVNPLKSYFGI